MGLQPFALSAATLSLCVHLAGLPPYFFLHKLPPFYLHGAWCCFLFAFFPPPLPIISFQMFPGPVEVLRAQNGLPHVDFDNKNQLFLNNYGISPFSFLAALGPPASSL